MTTQETTYGTITVTGFSKCGRHRYHDYKSKQDGEITSESILCLDGNDNSPLQTVRATVEMRENCHCCFAGYGHTVALCNDRNKI